MEAQKTLDGKWQITASDGRVFLVKRVSAVTPYMNYAGMWKVSENDRVVGYYLSVQDFIEKENVT